MTSLIKTGALAALLAFATGCAGTQVETEYDRSQDFDGFGTFAWYEPPAPDTGGAAVALDPDLERLLVDSVNVAFKRRGLELADPAVADLRLRYLVQINDRVQFNDAYYSFDVVTTYEEGALIFDVVEADTGERAWRGVARARLKDKESDEKRARRLMNAVDKLIARCPVGR